MLSAKESEEQICLFQWAMWNTQKFPELNLLFHVPNGGKRDKREAVSLKRQGVKAGVPDLVLPVPRGGYHGAYIEMKVGDNKTTDKQKKWIRDLIEQGYYVEVCYGWQEASEKLTKYLEKSRTIVKEGVFDGM
ncbi:VRR-NUC domain-containing protein [Clostridium saccharoperbutylacetonicum]